MLFDYEEVLVVSTTAFFAILAVGLLFRYRQVSRSAVESANIGKDLWDSMEARLRKQDERILDIMARMEVIQTRILALKTNSTSSPDKVSPPNSTETEARLGTANRKQISHGIEPQHEVQQESRESDESHPEIPAVQDLDASLALDETQIAVMRLLTSHSMDTRAITNALGKSREHTARVMKELFEMGLVSRTTNEKPFTYELTDQGRRRVPSGP